LSNLNIVTPRASKKGNSWRLYRK